MIACFSQVFPTEIRTLGTGICVSLATLANAFNAEFYHFMLHHIGKACVFVCVCVCVRERERGR